MFVEDFLSTVVRESRAITRLPCKMTVDLTITRSLQHHGILSTWPDDIEQKEVTKKTYVIKLTLYIKKTWGKK